MVSNKSLDVSKIIAALLHDVHNVHGLVFNTRNLRLTIEKVNRRLRSEGMGFLTKTLPRLGKALDRVLAGGSNLSASELGFSALPDSELPRFLGEFFKLVLRPDGAALLHPCAQCVKVIRQICYLFYKYELPYTDEQEQQVLQRFERTEQDLSSSREHLHNLQNTLESRPSSVRRHKTLDQLEVTREARILLSRLFAYFDPQNIIPRHGPGAVATKQQLWEKYQWTNVSGRITSVYPLDAYFYASLGHVCDRYQELSALTDKSLPAKVILVPKDSRGPRLISCEPVDYQWIQQGLGRAIVELVEKNPLSRYNIFFTDQGPNRRGAMLGSLAEPVLPTTGRYSTLDLNEASDRVSLSLVRLLFPPHICVYLEACRSLSTELPDGRVIMLEKFAPMGSSLCFPILALTIWAILTAAAPNVDTQRSILVYGDDVIVPTAYAENAMEQLESFGLKINRDKSCISGLFRESCGMDAFQGIDVTPVRLRTVWSSTPSPDVYTSWIAYANSFYDRQYYHLGDLISEALVHTYGPIPSKDMSLDCPSLWRVPHGTLPLRRRWNRNLQKCEYLVYDVKAPIINKEIDGWSMLLRFFSSAPKTPEEFPVGSVHHASQELSPVSALRVGQYTSRRTSMLVRRWR